MEIFLCTLLVLAPVVKILTCCCYSRTVQLCYSRTSQLTSEIITTKKETGHDDCSLSDLTTNRSWWLNLQQTGHDGWTYKKRVMMVAAYRTLAMNVATYNKQVMMVAVYKKQVLIAAAYKKQVLILDLKKQVLIVDLTRNMSL